MENKSNKDIYNKEITDSVNNNTNEVSKKNKMPKAIKFIVLVGLLMGSFASGMMTQKYISYPPIYREHDKNQVAIKIIEKDIMDMYEAGGFEVNIDEVNGEEVFILSNVEGVVEEARYTFKDDILYRNGEKIATEVDQLEFLEFDDHIEIILNSTKFEDLTNHHYLQYPEEGELFIRE